MKIKIKVFPKSGREEIIRISDEEYKVYLKKPAVGGKANIELLKLLKKHFGKEVKIKSGLGSRNKMTEL